MYNPSLRERLEDIAWALGVTFPVMGGLAVMVIYEAMLKSCG